MAQKENIRSIAANVSGAVDNLEELLEGIGISVVVDGPLADAMAAIRQAGVLQVEVPEPVLIEMSPTEATIVKKALGGYSLTAEEIQICAPICDQISEEAYEEWETTVAGVRFKRTGKNRISGMGNGTWNIHFSSSCHTLESFKQACAHYYHFNW